MATKTVVFEIKRQASPDAPAVWERFELPRRPGMNVISAMMEIAANPVTADGRQTTPITYDSNCLEEICGSCAMRINGKARMACSALVDNLEQPIKVEPLSKFPLVRDLQVERLLDIFSKPPKCHGAGKREHLRAFRCCGPNTESVTRPPPAGASKDRCCAVCCDLGSPMESWWAWRRWRSPCSRSSWGDWAPSRPRQRRSPSR